MLVLFEWCRVLAFVIGVGVNDNTAIGQLVRMQENNMVCNQQTHCKHKNSGKQFLKSFFCCCFHGFGKM